MFMQCISILFILLLSALLLYGFDVVAVTSLLRKTPFAVRIILNILPLNKRRILVAVVGQN